MFYGNEYFGKRVITGKASTIVRTIYKRGHVLPLRAKIGLYRHKMAPRKRAAIRFPTPFVIKVAITRMTSALLFYKAARENDINTSGKQTCAEHAQSSYEKSLTFTLFYMVKPRIIMGVFKLSFRRSCLSTDVLKGRVTANISRLKGIVQRKSFFF